MLPTSLKKGSEAYEIAILSVLQSVCLSLLYQLQISEPILIKVPTHVLSLADISMEAIQFLNFENCVRVVWATEKASLINTKLRQTLGIRTEGMTFWDKNFKCD
jgi:hypothetical protein